MRISRLYTSQILQLNSELSLDAEASHYLLRVLRLPPGQALILFNGDGKEYDAELESTQQAGNKQKIARVRINQAREVHSESPLHTVLGLGMSRGERMDYAIQKSTELGVQVIVPLLTEHCEVKLTPDRAAKRVVHWQQIAISACEQCGRVKPPLIAEPQNLSSWLANPPPGLRLLLDHRQEDALPEAPPQDGVVLLIGPEGGFSENEIKQARQAGFSAVALGPRVLRTETAPVVALSVLQYRWGDY